MFHQQSSIVLPLVSQFEKLTHGLDEAWNSLQEHGYPDDAWADIAPNRAPFRREDNGELQNALRLFRDNAEELPEEDVPDFSPNQTTGTITYHKDAQQVIPSNYHIEQMKSLKNVNPRQAQMFHFIKAYYRFLNWINRILTRPSGNPDLPVALLLSYTGTAAFNINGQTIHSAFSINRRMTKVLPVNSANTLRSNLQVIQLLIIDEVSMVPPDHLNLIHCRPQQIKQPFSSSAYFGNISPVAKKSFLSNNTSLTDLWSMFYIWELTHDVRQKGDQDFTALLNRRVGLNSRNRLKPPQHVHISSTVIVPQTEVIQRNPFQITRHQFPSMLPWAVTTHKIQGATTDTVVDSSSI
ncbi:hypothetical protein MAR_007228 [Mya arenaria]|uniref:ATP-dependent DNA helicase n=1 Tax=Mya arenaria TaxID=6604 RepID=A0ABY7DDB6_MYAAR|nr:hypothetical protein MAR_007228 [Mya arenaria]